MAALKVKEKAQKAVQSNIKKAKNALKPSLPISTKGKKQIKSEKVVAKSPAKKVGPFSGTSSLDKAQTKQPVIKAVTKKKAKSGNRKSLVITLRSLYESNNHAELKKMVPKIQQTVDELSSKENSTAVRKLRILKVFLKKIENLGKEGGKPKQELKKKVKNQPKIPKGFEVKDEESDENEEDDDDDDNEEDESVEETVKTTETATKKKKTRFVVFVGNLSNEITEKDVKEHFKKAGNIVSVRLPLGKDSQSKGIAFVEFGNEKDFQKGLSMNETMLKGRRIRVQFTEAKKEVGGKKGPRKDLKLKGMQKKGLLEGSTKQSSTRASRRKKAAAAKKNANQDSD